MTIPDYQSLMRPLLRLLRDGNEHHMRECSDALAREFNVSSGELAELLPSGRQSVFANRVSWATTYMAKAGLIERTGRSRVRITRRGRDALAERADRIDTSYLSRFPEFIEFQRRDARQENGQPPTVGAEANPPAASLSPEELLVESYQQLRRALAQELLDLIKQAPAAFFERLVLDLLVAMGYGGSLSDASQAVGGSGDGGIDGIIKEDRLGLDFVYVQAKRWDGPVGRPLVQAFAGSLEGQRARKGVMITTSRFTPDAKEYITRIEKRIVLLDGDQLADLMIAHGVGVADVATYRLQKVDADYFGDA